MLSSRKAFSIHADYYHSLRKLSHEQRGLLLTALIDWAEAKEPTGLDPVCEVLFDLMTASIERISKANSENAKKRFTNPKKPNRHARPECPNSSSTTDPNPHEYIEEALEDEPKPAVTFDDLAVEPYGTNGLVPLSGNDYSKLLSTYGQAKLDKGIEEVDFWLSTLDSNNIKDYAKQVRQAINLNWNRAGNRSKHNPAQNTFSSDAPPDSVHEQDFLKGVNQNDG